MTLFKLYDTFAMLLRTLDPLEVKSEIYTAMLLPLVQSSRPEEIMRAWEQSRQRKESAHRLKI